jgi:predicted metal-dependent phosphoesterase TrpH
MFSNPFELAGKWHKANLHTHTTVSDGRVSAAQRVEQYRDASYSVLAITDHSNISNAAV